MKYPTVSALCEGVAGAIREKEGSTEKINPQDFADRIKGLEGGGASGSKWMYLKRIGRLPTAGGGDIITYSAMSQVVRYEDSRWSDDGSVKAMIETGSQTLINNDVYPIAFGFDPNTIVFHPRMDAEKTTLWEKLANIVYYPATEEWPEEIDSNYFEEITEEQFYDLNTLLTPQEITFTVSGVEYTALDGMTWEEFCNSEYNVGGQDWKSDDLRFECDGNTIYAYKGELSSGRVVDASPTDTIIANTAYSINS